MRGTRVLRGLVVAIALISVCAPAFAGVFISVNFGPPALPVYEQPPCPAPGYLWTPGYWAYGPYGYYWVPGTWVVAPQPGLLWTPGYWGFAGGIYLWHAGYWGPTVGFYGGVPYGFGYTGVGFAGGYWRGGQYFYNRSVTNVNVTNVTNVYNTTVINNNVNATRVSYNGGPGGITAQPTAIEREAESQPHIQPTAIQAQHETTAQNNPQLRASVNQGRPPIAATAKAGEFSGRGVVAAGGAGAPYHPAANERAANAPAPRPQNNVPRPPSASAQKATGPQTMASAPRAQNNVPRPPSGSAPKAARPENSTSSAHSAAPRESSAPPEHNSPRPEAAPKKPATHPATKAPAEEPRRESR